MKEFLPSTFSIQTNNVISSPLLHPIHSINHEHTSVSACLNIFLQKAEQKLMEINNARNESMEALKSHREEFGLLRTKIHESVNKIKEYEELKKQKEAEYNKISTSINEGKAKLEKELAQLKRWE